MEVGFSSMPKSSLGITNDLYARFILTTSKLTALHISTLIPTAFGHIQQYFHNGIKNDNTMFGEVRFNILLLA